MNACKCCFHKQKNMMEFFKIQNNGEKELNVRELTNIVYELVKRNGMLEERLLKIENRETRKAKKNIIEYLKQHPANHSFVDWLKKVVIRIDVEDLLSLHHFSYPECVLKVLKRTLTAVFKEGGLPLSAYTEKRGIVYVFNGDEWREITHEELKKIAFLIYEKFNDVYFTWEKANRGLANFDDLSDLYMCKIDVSVSLKEQKLNDMRRILYDVVHVSMRDIIEYY